MPKYTPSIGTYTALQLEDDANYISTKKAFPLFSFVLKGKRGAQTINGWIRKGYLLGRCINLSPRASPHQNDWQVFIPDIDRFRKDLITKI